MKIGIMTFHNADNYGAVLQAYALQTALRQKRHEALLIDYTGEYLKHPFGLDNFRRKGIIGEALTLAGEFSRFPRRRAFQAFRKDYLMMTPELKKESLSSLNKQFDLFVTGSDQVWNYNLTNFDGAYLLDFVSEKSKKGSYAASFGFSNLNPKYRDWYRQHLQDFQYLNIREESGARLIKDLLNRVAEVVLDPTFLLTKEQWEELAVTPPVSGEYILTYQLGISSPLLQYAKKLSDIYQCPIYSIPIPQGELVKSTSILDAGPKEWLGWIQNAKCIVTDSFHGMALSIILEKEFIVSYPSQETKTRQESLLNALQIENHTLTCGDMGIPPELDYAGIQERLTELRETSFRVLSNMVN